MHTSNYIYHDGELELHGFVAYDKTVNTPRPAVLVVHDWSGNNDFACHQAKELAKLGYVGFAVDMYGEGREGHTLDEKKALMEPLLNDRGLLLQRVQAGLDAVKTIAEVDVNQIAVIGFCFGGLCALDLVRSGADIVGAVSFHGLLNKPDNAFAKTIQAKVLVLHGYDDPMVPPEQVKDFCREMTEAKIDWQVYAYGHTKHAFTNPNAHNNELGTVYNAKAVARAWLSMQHFLKEIFSAS